MRAVIVLPDGVGIRNFLLGPFLRLLQREASALVLHPIPDELLPLYSDGLDGQVTWRGLLPYREGSLSSFLRYAASYAHFHHFDTQGMRYVRSLSAAGGLRTRLGRRLARQLGKAMATPDGIAFLEKWRYRLGARALEVTRYRQIFLEMNPSVLFCSHQRPTEAVPTVLAARSLGIPTATFIFSWDNLSSKARIVAPYDHYLVWSSLMKREMDRYYPEVPQVRVHIVGTPQFDPYRDPALQLSREEFCRWAGADPNRPVICFSGSDLSTAPDDPAYVQIVMEEIRRGHIRHRPQIVLRPAPVDTGERFEPVRQRFPELLYKVPDWLRTRRDWKGAIPLPADLTALASLTYHCALNLNVSSTMTLDFALRDKPVVNIAFDVTQPPPFGVPLWEFHFRFEHYLPVVRLGAARFARDRAELVKHINAYLDDATLDREARRKFADLELDVPIGESSQQVIEALKRISR
jgi:hypothetical protein